MGVSIRFVTFTSNHVGWLVHFSFDLGRLGYHWVRIKALTFLQGVKELLLIC